MPDDAEILERADRWIEYSRMPQPPALNAGFTLIVDLCKALRARKAEITRLRTALKGCAPKTSNRVRK
jgi:hypothetical protein